MKQSIKTIAMAGITQLIVWTHLNAQLELLPEGFPTEGVVAKGDNQFTSPVFGTFRIDPTFENRVLHDVLGPFVWEYSNALKIATIRSEWWGNLHTTLPSETSMLGFTWPYVLGELTEFIFIVDATGTLSPWPDRPFFNHTRSQQPGATPPYWQRSIGVPLDNAELYHRFADDRTVRMQQTSQVMGILRDQIASMPVAVGNDNIDQHRSMAVAELINLNRFYGEFLFFRNRANRAPVFVERQGGTATEISRSQWFVEKVEELAELAGRLIAEGQTILFEEIDGADGIYTKKKAEREKLEGSGDLPQDPVNDPTDAISWSDVIFAPGNRIPASMSEVSGWPVSAQLRGLQITRSGQDFYGHWDVSGAANWPNIISAGPSSVQKGVNGNSWIFVPHPQQPGKWIASPFEGFIGSRASGTHTLGNLNIPHTNAQTNFNHRDKILKGSMLDYSRTEIWGTPQGMPKSGVTYGWMVSTNAGLYSGVGTYGKARSNIILVTWP